MHQKEILNYVQNHVHLYLCLDPIEIPCSSHKDAEEDGISSCEEQTQPVKSLSTSEVESENLSESDIDPFETMYGEMDEDSFHQMMEGNDWTYYPLFSDKEFLNEDWHKYTCIESCAAVGNARHECESFGTDIWRIREIDDSGSTWLSEIGNMMTNITGSSILKSTVHTSQVKPGKLSVRFILSDREPCSADPSSKFERTSDAEQSEVVSADESEIGIVSELEDDWYSCESSDDEDKYLYDAVSLVNSHDASLISLPHQVTETPCETNLDGLVLGCRQHSKSDQVTDLSEKACLHEVIQVPELNETYLCEGKLKNKDDDSHLRILSNMMEEETHVDSISSGKQADIYQTLFDIVEDQSDVHRRAVKETAISGHPQSDQLRSGKPDGEPGTHITTNISDRQSQMVEGNLSLNSPNFFAGNPLHDVYFCSKCKPMDESGIWSILTDTSQYVKAEVDSSVTYSFDQERFQNSKSRYFDEKSEDLSNKNTSIDKNFNAKKENFDAAKYNVPNVPIYSQQLFFVEDRYGNLSLFTMSYFKPHESICATYLWTEDNNCTKMESEAYDLEGNNMQFKQGKFPINLHGETEGEIMDGNGIKVTTLMDSGCSKPILNKKFYDKHPYLHQFSHYPLQAIGVVVANVGVIKVTEAIQFMVKFHEHVFEFIAYLADMSESFDLVIGQKSMYELEASVDFNNLAFSFLERSLPVCAV